MLGSDSHQLATEGASRINRCQRRSRYNTKEWHPMNTLLLLLLQAGERQGDLSCCVLPIIILLVILGLGVVQARQKMKDEKYDREEKRKNFEKLKPLHTFPVGKYVAGLPKSDAGGRDVFCAVTENDFIFTNTAGYEIDRIPRDAINQIIVEDKSQISQRLTVTRIAALGVFALAAPKKEKTREFCLLIDWNGSKGMRENTIFEFSGEMVDRVNSAANTLRRYAKTQADTPKPSAAAPTEKQCPYCAETIKAAAKICRFCNRELAT